MTLDDSFLIRQVLNGNREAFRFLVLRYQRPIFKFLHSFSLPASRVEELAQETFLRAYRSLESYDSAKGASFSSWLFLIAKNLSLNELGRHSFKNEVLPDEETQAAINMIPSQELPPDRHMENQQSSEALAQAIQRLPIQFRNAVVLSCLHELSLEEVASIEGCTVGTVKSRVFRGKQLLRSLLCSAGTTPVPRGERT